MIMNNSIRFLNSSWLNHRDKLEVIDYWKKVLNRPQGWHYDLDIIWILHELDKSGIKKGSTILDAGAGLGITQFILASLGYNVISFDFSDRKFTWQMRKLFSIDAILNSDFKYQHEYMNFVKYNAEHRREKVQEVNGFRLLTKVKNIFFNKLHTIGNFIYFLHALTRNRSNFGTIKVLRGAFHEINLKDFSVDAIVSVSALEHADKKLLHENLNEFKRVVKKDGVILISTSGNDDCCEDSYHSKTKGICFSKETLSTFAEDLYFDNYNYLSAENDLLNNKLFISRLDRYYVQDPLSEFYKRYIKKLPYMPVGISIFKNL